LTKESIKQAQKLGPTKVRKETLLRKRTKLATHFWSWQKAERPIKEQEIIKGLNPVIRGWVNYFKIANSSKKFGKIRLYTAGKVRKFMRRRRNKSGYGYKKYPDD